MSTPIISLQAVTGTFDGTRNENRDRILASELVEFLGDQPGASVLSLVLDVDGEIPADGLEVIIRSDGDFSQYLANMGREPFSIGGELLEVMEDTNGTPNGIRVLVTGPNVLFSFAGAQTETAETDGPESLMFVLVGGPGYTTNDEAQIATVTFYDTLADVPAPSSTPTVGISIDNTELVEATADAVTLTFSVDGEIPDEGVLVYVDSGVRAAIGEFDIFNAEISGGVFPSANFLSSGFYFKVLEDGASITLTVFDETLNPQIDPADAAEGVESFTFSIIEGPGYAIDPDANSVSFTIADEVDSALLESLETSSDIATVLSDVNTSHDVIANHPESVVVESDDGSNSTMLFEANFNATIAKATDTALSADNATAVTQSATSFTAMPATTWVSPAMIVKGMTTSPIAAAVICLSLVATVVTPPLTKMINLKNDVSDQ